MFSLSRIDCLGDALRDATLAYKSEIALLEADRHRETAHYRYLELKREAERVTARLQERGFAPGDRCAILMSNQSKWVVSGLGALWAGAVLVPLDYKLSAPEQIALLAHAKPRALVTEYHIWRELHAHGAVAEDLHVLLTEAPASADLLGGTRWEEAAAGAFRYQARKRDDLACIVYSSGTGGTPKGCMLTHDNYLEQAQVLGPLFPMTTEDRYFSILPTNHAIDFMGGMILPFLFGAAVVHQRTLRAEFLAPTMKRYRVTHTAMVPRILKALEEKIREQLDALPGWQRAVVDTLIGVNDFVTLKTPRHELSRTLLKPIHDSLGGRLRMIIAGGAFVEPDLAAFFYKLGLPVVIGYGLTEACMVLTVNDLAPFRATTVGKPVPGVEIEVRSPNSDGVGEVFARGRTVMRGYLDAPELTREVMCDGWLRTGDLGMLDASGHLKLVGRAKNMIVTQGGKNVYPEDVERAFEHLDCEESCVFAARFIWPGSALGQDELTLVLRPRKGQPVQRLIAAMTEANKQLAEYKRIASYVVWEEEFPRTASMKVKRDPLAHALRSSPATAEPLRA